MELNPVFKVGYLDKIETISLGWLIDDLITLRLWLAFDRIGKPVSDKLSIEQELVIKHTQEIKKEIKRREDLLIQHINVAT